MDFLNQLLEREVENYEIHDIRDLQYVYDMIAIINRHKKNFSLPKYKRKYSLKKSFEHSYNALSNISFMDSVKSFMENKSY